jgi:hypothetical protein
MKFNLKTTISKSLDLSVTGLLLATMGTPLLAAQTINSHNISNKSINSEKTVDKSSYGTIEKVPVQLTQAKNCKYEDNLNEVANKFIGKCCKGSINAEFPTILKTETLQFIQEAKKQGIPEGKKAYKLLNDGRFRK